VSRRNCSEILYYIIETKSVPHGEHSTFVIKNNYIAVSENAGMCWKNLVKIYKHNGCQKYRVFDVKPGGVFTDHLASKG
jgi:hypothetical protein